jgi:hypothetical protein
MNSASKSAQNASFSEVIRSIQLKAFKLNLVSLRAVILYKKETVLLSEDFWFQLVSVNLLLILFSMTFSVILGQLKQETDLQDVLVPHLMSLLDFLKLLVELLEAQES